MPPGFSDPTQWKSVKSVGALLGWIGGISGDPAAASILGGIGSAITGSGSGLYEGIMGAVPQPFGNLPAPGPMPGAPGVGGPTVDNSNHVEHLNEAPEKFLNNAAQTTKFNSYADFATRNFIP